ncbi:hypothetical protein B0T16DRAFT_414313 [Cercophora newfieldiana]|uniref:Heterokaryon incompatibility domain-containing protein n=1 Tax=Cercophora newfieldiana TaxID=92897 RepID=A0AA39Y692_9PEZI|nr:hypothetical protein B0T16DRAFT_414313 [Cercophora newfieldiana]
MTTTNGAATPIELDPVHLQPEQDEDAEADEAGLCERCRYFDIQAFARSENRTRGYMLHDVRFAATANSGTNRDGCALCSLLLRSVEDIDRPRDTTEWELNPFRIPVEKDPSMYVHMTMCADNVVAAAQPTNAPGLGLGVNRIRTAVADRFSEVMNPSDHELCLVADSDSPAAHGNDITGRYLGTDPGSDAHFDAIQAWIRDCQSHPKCMQTVSGVPIDVHQADLPARCVQLTGHGADLAARLAVTEGIRGSYITLTHRWNGETELCKTTADNCDQRQQDGIDLQGLPKLFRDVFTVATRLGVSYVWIDSLCIIQSGDGGADWKKEAPRMAQYYQYSLFTIAGTMEDIDNGLLQPYSQDNAPWGPTNPLIRLPYRDKTGSPAGHFFVYRRQVPVVDDYCTTVRESILFRRGWILQEWLLSKRLVWYTPRGLFLECHTDGPRTEYQERVLVANAQPHLRAQLQMKANFHFGNAAILDFWYRTIEHYSSCSLTRPDQDRILAVAGLAKEVGRILADRTGDAVVEGNHHEMYLAGLWLRDIHHGLLWEEDHAAPPCNEVVGQAPSWSWASLMMLVRWPDKDYERETALRVVGLCLSRREQDQDQAQGRDGEHAESQDAEQHHRRHNAEYAIERGGWAVPARPAAASPAPPVRAPFDPTNMFACLHIRGRLCTVHVRGYLGTDGKAKAAAATAYTNRPPSEKWRAICSRAKPEVIAGWASAERLEQPDAACADAGVAVQVLLVSTRFRRKGAYLKRRDRVLDVLLVEEIDARAHVFRRLGVGRIFDGDLVAELETAGERDFQFV